MCRYRYLPLQYPADAVEALEVNHVSSETDATDQLFSPDPQVRWESSRPLSTSRGWNKARINRVRLAIQLNQPYCIDEHDIDPMECLPERFHGDVRRWGKHFAFAGSLNAWMVFVGPSPGGSPSESKKLNDLLDAAFHKRNPVLGRPHPSLYYPDGQGFFDVVREWVNGAYRSSGYFRRKSDEFAALSSFMTINLTKAPEGDATKVSRKGMERGATRFWQYVAPIMRPHLIVALTRGAPSVFEILCEAAEDVGLESNMLTGDRFQGSRRVYRLPKAVIRSKEWGPVLIATVPTHPSHIREWIKWKRIQSGSDVIEHLDARVREAAGTL